MIKINVNRKISILAGLVIVLLFFSFQSKFFEIAKQIEIYNALFKELNMYYVDEINPAEITEKAIKNTLKDLDPYTNFYNEQDVESAQISREGEYGGIGISVYYTSEGIEIKEVLKGFSADKSGLKAGDIVIEIDGQSLENMKSEDLSTFLKGSANTVFSAVIKRQEKRISKELKREKIVVNPVPFYEMIDQETGYIILTQFNEKASSEVKKAFKLLKKKGMKKLVFDLRSNPGGSLLEAIHISNFFLPKGETMVSMKAKIKKWSQVYTSSKDPLDLKIPVVVLLNDRSASASEVVSGALQDYDRAVIMGQRSFGKGLVQRHRELTYGTQLKVTIAKYYTPSGRCIQELDYANRDENGKVPKFSDNGITKFSTKNGRAVYDGGGILPDVLIETSKKTEATKKLLSSKAIFNFVTRYFYENPELSNGENYKFSDSDFKKFTTYLKKDTTFITTQEKMFKKAFLASENSGISKDYERIKKILFEEKIKDISSNKDILMSKIEHEIIARYFYQEGVYESTFMNDTVIKEAVKLLKDEKKYSRILTKNN